MSTRDADPAARIPALGSSRPGDDPTDTGRSASSIALRISLVYLIFGLAWILLSDRLLLILDLDPSTLTQLQSVKGVFYVGITGFGLYILLRLGYRRLAESEAYFRSIFEDAPLGITIADIQGRPERCNHSMQALLGYSNEELQRMSYADFTHPDDLESSRHQFARLTKGEIARYTLNKRYLHKDGHAVTVRLTTSAIRGAGGQVSQIMGMVEDVSELLRQQERWRDSQADLQLAQKIAHIGNWQYRVADGGIRWSDETYRIFGLEPQSETPSYDRIMEFVHSNDRQAHDDYLQRIISCRPGEAVPPFTCRLVRRGGELRYVQVVAEPHFETTDRPDYIFGTVQDVTSRELTEDALRQSEERLSMALLASHEGIWEWDLSDGAPWWSEDYDREANSRSEAYEPPSAPAWLVERIHPEDRPRVEASLRAAVLDRSGKQWDAEYRFLDDQGTYQLIVDRAVITRDGKGRAHRVMGARLEMTDTMAARMELDRFFELSPDVLGIARPDGRFQRVSPAFSRILGLNEGDLLEQPYLDFVHPDDREATLAAAQDLENGHAIQGFENRYLDAQGEVHWFQWHATAAPGHGLFYAIGRDITEQKTAQQRLVDTERRWTLALDGGGHGVWDWNAVTNKVYFSGGWKRMLGYNDDDVGDTLEEWESRVHPDDLPGCYADLQRHFDGETPMYRNEHRMRCKDGGYKWILDQGTVFEHTAGGRPLRVVGTHTDITERKAAEQALVETERRAEQSRLELESVFNALPDLYFRIAGDGTILDYRADTGSELYIPPEQFLGKRMQSLMPEEINRVFVAHFARLQDSGERQTFEYRLEVNGRENIYEARLLPLADSDQIISVVRNITEVRHAEQRLHTSESRFRDLIESTLDWAWETDAAGRYTYASPRCRDLLGYEPEELLGKTPFDLMPGDEAERVGNNYRALSSARANIRALANRNRHRDGHEVILETNATPIIDAEGVFSGYRGIDRDITERVRVEQALVENRNVLRIMIDAVPFWISYFDRDKRYVIANRKYQEVFGRPLEEIEGQLWRDVLPPHIAETHGPLSDRCLAGETLIHEESTTIDGDGRIYVESHYIPVRETEGKVIGGVVVVFDVTEQRNHGLELAEKEIRYRHLVENMSDGVAVYEAIEDGADFVVLEHNRAGERIAQQSRERVVGKRATEAFPGIEELGLLDTLRRVWRSGRAEHHPVTRYSDDRVELWVENYVFKLPAGQIVAVYKDVTEERNNAQALKRSEQIFRGVFEQAAVGVIIIEGGSGRIVRANQRFCDIVGLEPSQIDTRSLLQFTHPDDIAAENDLMMRLITGQIREFNAEQRLLRSDGENAWVNLTVSPTWYPEGDSAYYIAIVEDISERRIAEARLRAEHDKNALLLTTTSEGYVLSDTQGWLREVNPAYCGLVGYTLDELLHMNLSELDSDFQAEKLELRLAELRSGATARIETRHRRKDGAFIDLEISASLTEHAGEPLIASFVHDITESKRAGEQLRLAHEELERRVAERTAELSAANRDLESFTYSVSHDLRAPLRAIRGFSRALLEDYGGDLVEGAKNYLRQIDASGLRMGDLIDGLLTLSRSSRGEITRESVDISAVAIEVAGRLSQSEPRRQVEIEVEPGLHAEADLRLIKTLLNNLLENAWKYTQQTDEAKIRIYGTRKDREAVFCVADNGAGFEMSFADKLFEPFQRLHRQDEFPGIGIGLATVQRIVHRHGGWITGEGKPGLGSTFCFTLSPGKRGS